MAAQDTLNPPAASPFQAIADNLGKLSQRQKLAAAIALAVGISLVVGVWLWSSKPAYSILFSNVTERDGGAIVTALQQQNVPYRVENGGSTILVPEDRANELRLTLASQGLPKGGLVGFELLENQKIGVSQFNEQINYQRGLEGELARTIQSISAVAGARVHLAMPKQSAFLRDAQKPTASVVVNLYAGRKLEPQQVSGIVHLVAASVPELASDQVSIIDQNGNLLTRARDPRSAALDSTQLGYVEEVETSYIKRIETILSPVLGSGNFRAQVTADVDFDATEQTSETYRPNPSPNTAIRSQQSNENLTNQPAPMGVPGALSNQPPVPASAPITSPPVLGQQTNANGVPVNTNKSSTINYEVDKTVQHVKRSLGSVKRLSVAVVVNNRAEKNAKGEVKAVPRTEEEMKQINALVVEAVGFSKDRGDTLNLANTAFTEPEKEVAAELPFLQDPNKLALMNTVLRWAAVLAALLIVVLFVLRPLMRTLAPPVEEKTDEEAAAPTTLAAAMEEQEKADEDIPPEVLQAELAKMSFEKKVARAKEIAAKEPKMVAQMLKEWMGSAPSGEGR